MTNLSDLPYMWITGISGLGGRFGYVLSGRETGQQLTENKADIVPENLKPTFGPRNIDAGGSL